MRTRRRLAAIAMAIMVASTSSQAGDGGLVDNEKAQVVKVLGERLRDLYVDAASGSALQAMLARQYSTGAYADVHSHAALAGALTADLQKHGRDRHLRVMLDEAAAAPDEAAQQASRDERMKADNFGVGTPGTLPGNIAYLELRGFAPLSEASAAFAAAMQQVAGCAALIIDLRRNGGGDPASVAYVSSYLFEKRTHLNDLRWRSGNRVDSFWTSDTVPGNKLSPSTPVYVLTGRQTFSAAEEFAYNLQQLKRATIVGEITGGGAHPGKIVDLSGRYLAFIPTGRAVNPISKTNWEGVGVQPDVVVPASEALLEAQRLALGRLLALAPNGEAKAGLAARLAELKQQSARSVAAFSNQPLYLRGSMNAWDTSVRLKQSDAARFEVDLPLAAGFHEFKIASGDFTTVDLGAARAQAGPVLDAPVQMVDGGDNLTVRATSAARYRFALDVADPARPQLTVSRVPQ